MQVQMLSLTVTTNKAPQASLSGYNWFTDSFALILFACGRPPGSHTNGIRITAFNLFLGASTSMFMCRLMVMFHLLLLTDCMHIAWFELDFMFAHQALHSTEHDT